MGSGERIVGLGVQPNRGAVMSEFDDRLNWIDNRAQVLPNVWLGVTAENQARADERIPDLLATPAARRFVSVEPMLGPVDLAYTCFNGADSFGTMPGIDWVIAGPETGPGKRPCDPAWIRDLYEQCRAAGVPFWDKSHEPLAREAPE